MKVSRHISVPPWGKRERNIQASDTSLNELTKVTQC